MQRYFFLLFVMMGYLVILSAQMEKVDQYFEQGEKYYNEKNWDTAQKAWFECEKYLPENKESTLYRVKIKNNFGVIEFQKGNFSQARYYWFDCAKSSENQIKINPGNEDIQNILGAVYQNLGLVYKKLSSHDKARKYENLAKKYLGNQHIVTTPMLLSLAFVSSPTKASTEVTVPLLPKEFQAHLLTEESGKLIPCQNKLVAVRNNFPLKLALKSPCYAYAYYINENECEFIQGLSITPDEFHHNQYLLSLDLATIVKQKQISRNFIIWYCSPQKLENPTELGNSIKNFTNSQIISPVGNIVFRGFDEEESPKTIEYQMQQRILFAIMKSTYPKDFSIETLAEFEILHTPLQIRVFLKDRKNPLRHNDTLYCGENIQIKITNHSSQLLYLYVFHCDEHEKVSQLLPRKHQANSCLQPGECDILKSATEYYRLDNIPGWEYIFFFYRDKPTDADILYKAIESLAKNKQLLRSFVPGNEGNYLLFRNYSDIVSIEKEPNSTGEKLEENWKDVVVIKFYKEEKK